MPNESERSPRKASTGSYPGRTQQEPRMVSGKYQTSRINGNTQQIPLSEVKSTRRGSRRTTIPNSEKERFDFKELFSKKNMKKFNRQLIFYIILVTISLLITWGVIVAANDINAFIKEDETIVITVPQGAGVKDIAKVLKQNGVIESENVFEAYCKFKKSSGFQFGEYELNSNMCYKEIISALKQPSESRATAKITIPEGYQQSEIVNLLVEKGYADKAKLEDVLANYDFDYDFVKALPKRNNRLEGYLFPDTYEIYVGDEVSIVNTMLKNFANKIESLQSDIDKSGHTLDEIIIMASIVEREGANNSEFANVASVFYNRLNSATYPYLESCATVQYILPQRKSVLSIADTKTDNPYNTYKYKGLPPGPIACPGLAAIKAAITPAETDYYFFVASENGTLFSKTYNEHLSNVKKAGNGSTGTSTVN